jgi:hypothetical protein
MLSTAWLSAFAPVGGLQKHDQWVAAGAGLFFHKPPLLWFVTANHVVDAVGASAISTLVTRAAGGGVIVVEMGKILASNGFAWVRDTANDLAAAPMPNSSEWAIKAVSPEVCIPLSQLVPSMPCFTIGCPYSLTGFDANRATPLVLDGVISGVDPANNRIYTSARTFPGNSGGPLIAIRTPFTPEGNIMGGQMVLLAGIMLESVLVPSPVPGDRMPPLHLGKAVPTDAILALLDSTEAKSIVSRVAAIQP